MKNNKNNMLKNEKDIINASNGTGDIPEKNPATEETASGHKGKTEPGANKKGNRSFILIALAFAAILAIGVMIGYFVGRKPKESENSGERVVLQDNNTAAADSVNAVADTAVAAERDENAAVISRPAVSEAESKDSRAEISDNTEAYDIPDGIIGPEAPDSTAITDSPEENDTTGRPEGTEISDKNDKTEKPENTGATEKPAVADKIGATENAGGSDNTGKPEGIDNISKDENTEKTENNESNKKPDINDNPGNNGNSDKADSSDKTGSSDKAGSSDRTDKSDKGSRSDSKQETKAAKYILTYSSDNSWQNGDVTMYGVQFGITNGASSTVSGWKLVMNIEGFNNIEGWNGTFSSTGTKLTVTDAGYNADIYSNGTVVFGGNLGIKGDGLRITSATLNGMEMTVQAGKVDQNNQNNNPGNNGNNSNDGNNGENVGNRDNNGSNNGSNNGTVDKISAGTDINELLQRSERAVQGDDWLHTDGRRILDKDGKQVWLTGLNWFGYNTGTNTFDGLWNSQLEPTVKAIADHGFNLIRVPISAELINQWASGTYPKANYNNAYNTALNSMNSLEIFDYFLALAEANGIKVMPDIHSAETNASGHNVNLWYTNRISVKEYYSALEWMADRYKNNDTIIAYDLKNEPHGKPYEGDGAAIWNDSKKANNWKYTAETAAAKILAKNPNVLIMVEGTEIYPVDISKNGDYHSTNDKDYYFNWWGGNLRAVADYPINLGKYQNKLVYSPHDYGPTVYEQPWFEGGYDYDSLMKDCWHDNWFYIYEENIAPLLIGEWGGYMTKPNITWMTYMRKLIGKYHLNHTFWCLNANSGDTGGLLLDDFKTWDTEKYNFVKEVLWQEGGKFVGLDHAIPLGDNGITLSRASGLK